MGGLGEHRQQAGFDEPLRASIAKEDEDDGRYD
jgi:hypothetical protein